MSALLLITTARALAGTTADIDEECPLDGTRFRATVDASGASSGMRLDLKKVGAIHEPSLLAECPSDHFVLYKNSFAPEELAALRKIVASPAYKGAVAAKESTYFLLAKIYEQLGKSDYQLANLYLRASWQVEEEPARYASYAGQSLAHLNAFLGAAAAHDDDWVTAQLLAGELERRLGKFELAQARFAKLQTIKDPPIAAIVQYELTLLAAKDAGPHEAPKK